MNSQDHPFRQWAVDEMRLRRFAPLPTDCEVYQGCCQSNANSSPIGRTRPYYIAFQAIRFCHSARAAERFAL